MKKTIEQLENDERIRELNSEKYKKDRELTEKINDIRNLESQNENLQKHRAVMIHRAMFKEEGLGIDPNYDQSFFFEHVLSRLYPNGKLIGISTPVGPTTSKRFSIKNTLWRSTT